MHQVEQVRQGKVKVKIAQQLERTMRIQISIQHNFLMRARMEENSNNSGTMGDNAVETEKCLRVYNLLQLLLQSGIVRTVEEEFNLVTTKVNQVFKQQNFIIISDKE